jgi:hypothetical protein
MNFKVGDKVQVKGYLGVYKISSLNKSYAWLRGIDTQRLVDLLPIKDLELVIDEPEEIKFPYGSIVIDNDGYKRKIIGVCDDVRFVATDASEHSFFDFTSSVRYLTEKGYKPYTESSDESVELTLEQIAEKFGIDVKDLKIKEN